MKKILTALFLLVSSFIYSDTVEIPTEKAKGNDQFEYFYYYFDGSDDNLYFNIELKPGLKFADTYTTWDYEDGKGCEIICQPIEGSEIWKQEDEKLEELRIKVRFRNKGENNPFYFRITAKGLYETIYHRINGKGLVEKGPKIDLQHRATFYEDSQNERIGFIRFKIK